jgi:lipopolysaccharide transport system permease protein
MQIIRPQSKFSLNLSEVWQYRELLYFFAWRDIKVRYKQAILGLLWTILQPLAMMVIFVIVIHHGMGIENTFIPAPLFYLSGLIIWNLFSQSVSDAANSMVSNANIIKKIYFPRIIIPISSILTSSFDFLANATLFLALCLFYQWTGKIEIGFFSIIVALAISYFITILTSLGLGTLLSAINVKYRDVRYALPFVIQVLFFISPVIYDSDKINNSWINGFISHNPIHSAIQILRSALPVNDFQNLQFPIPSVYIVIICTLAGGLYTFRSMEAYFADIA